MSITLVIPTYNAGENFKKIAEKIMKQTANIDEVLILDTSSLDETVKIAKDFGFSVEIILPQHFGHGKTRQYALEKAKNEIVVFMTQDALPANEYAVEKLVEFLNKDEKLAAVYGKQLPAPDTGTIAAFARKYNYSEESFMNRIEERAEKGLKLTFLSNSFAAYKKSLLTKIGGFPKHVDFGEDCYVAAKLLQAGYKTGYCAQAMVYHAHDYNLREEYMRGKAIGKFHQRENWLLEYFGRAEGEGAKFIRSEIKYFLKTGKWYVLPQAFIHNIAKFIGYKVGYGKL